MLDYSLSPVTSFPEVMLTRALVPRGAALVAVGQCGEDNSALDNANDTFLPSKVTITSCCVIPEDASE